MCTCVHTHKHTHTMCLERKGLEEETREVAIFVEQVAKRNHERRLNLVRETHTQWYLGRQGRSKFPMRKTSFQITLLRRSSTWAITSLPPNPGVSNAFLLQGIVFLIFVSLKSFIIPYPSKATCAGTRLSSEHLGQYCTSRRRSLVSAW